MQRCPGEVQAWRLGQFAPLAHASLEAPQMRRRRGVLVRRLEAGSQLVNARVLAENSLLQMWREAVEEPPAFCDPQTAVVVKRDIRDAAIVCLQTEASRGVRRAHRTRRCACDTERLAEKECGRFLRFLPRVATRRTAEKMMHERAAASTSRQTFLLIIKLFGSRRWIASR